MTIEGENRRDEIEHRGVEVVSGEKWRERGGPFLERVGEGGERFRTIPHCRQPGTKVCRAQLLLSEEENETQSSKVETRCV